MDILRFLYKILYRNAKLNDLMCFCLEKMQSDSYRGTGCYNLMCSGFVQINNKIAMGGSIYPISRYGGPQYDVSILIWKVRRKRACNVHSNLKKKNKKSQACAHQLLTHSS